MKLFNSILGFLKTLFSKKSDSECTTCESKDVCQTVDRSKKYALVVGMENSKWGNCSGADKDSNTMYGLVTEFVDANHIVRLNDAKGTTAAVRDALNSQIAKVPEDGLFIFTYSGHGGQTSKTSSAKDDPDGKDEFLCLYDGYIIDNDLWIILNKCKGRVLLCLDCCHSGTMYRLDPSGKQTEDDKEFEEIENPFFAKYANIRDCFSTKMFVISGCGEETVSWGDAINGGVLTCALKRNFNKCLSYKDYWTKVRADAGFKRVKQVPVCTAIAGFDTNAKIFN